MSQLADNDADYVLVFDGVNGLRMAPRGAAGAFEGLESGRLSMAPPATTPLEPPRARRSGAGRVTAVIGMVIGLGLVGFVAGRRLTEPTATAPTRVTLSKPAPRAMPASAPILATPGPVPPGPVATPARAVPSRPARHAETARRSATTRPATRRRPGPATTSCVAGGWTDRLVCRDPALAAEDARLAVALKAAAQAGVPIADLQAGQFTWLAARNAAARRSNAEVSAAYRRRIEAVESLANEAPPY